MASRLSHRERSRGHRSYQHRASEGTVVTGSRRGESGIEDGVQGSSTGTMTASRHGNIGMVPVSQARTVSGIEPTSQRRNSMILTTPLTRPLAPALADCVRTRNPDMVPDDPDELVAGEEAAFAPDESPTAPLLPAPIAEAAFTPDESADAPTLDEATDERAEAPTNTLLAPALPVLGAAGTTP